MLHVSIKFFITSNVTLFKLLRYLFSNRSTTTIFILILESLASLLSVSYKIMSLYCSSLAQITSFNYLDNLITEVGDFAFPSL